MDIYNARMNHMTDTPRCLRFLFRFIALGLALFASDCPAKELQSFAPDGVLSANIRRTDFGVPHIKAHNLESLGFGVGYAFAENNTCILADIITRYNSERARYFGPDLVPGSKDAQHLISDFGFLALEIREQAEASIDHISERQHALIAGYVQGYNQYLARTAIDQQDPTCAGKPWVRPITEVDLLTALLGIALFPGAAQFLTPMFIAAPPDVDFSPVLAPSSLTRHAPIPPLKIALSKINLPEKNPLELGSNAWALGRDKTRNHRGLLLANPHFPHTGDLRFWEFHATIPGFLDVMGSSLAGTPGIVNVGFNQHLAWSHTFSTAEHLIAYRLELDRGDDSGLSYLLDGSPRPIVKKTKTLPVAVGPGQVIPYQKDFYYSEFGPMVMIPDFMRWGEDPNFGYIAYSIKDANTLNLDIVDHWLAMNLARNLSEFKTSFEQYNGVIFNNTLVADDEGNTFYIDDSTVPALSPEAEAKLRDDPILRNLRAQAGFSILPGNTSANDFSGPVPYANAPKLERPDFVQNSNDSFWLTNPDQRISGVSILYGKTNNQQTLRSRMGHTLLQDSAGPDGRFATAEVEAALFSFRNYLGENILAALLSQCQAQGDTPVPLENTSVNIAAGCAALAQWDGRFDKNSIGAVMFREFANEFQKDPQWLVPFDSNLPLSTPSGLQANAKTLQQLAQAMLNLQTAGIAPDVPLGAAQFVQRTDANGLPSAERLPWSGSHNLEGGFNVFRPVYNGDLSLLPRTHYSPVPGSQISADGKGYSVDYGSSWMMIVEFTDKGPKAKGLMTYSQSIDPRSDHQLDQSRLYSEQPQLVPMPFTNAEIKQHLQSDITIKYRKPQS